MINICLVADIDGGFDHRYILQTSRVGGRFVVACKAKEANFPGLLCLDQGADSFPPLQGFNIAGMKQHDIQMICLQPTQGAIHSVKDYIF